MTRPSRTGRKPDDLHWAVVERYRNELDATRDEYERVHGNGDADRGRLVAARARLAATVSRYDAVLRSAGLPPRRRGD